MCYTCHILASQQSVVMAFLLIFAGISTAAMPGPRIIPTVFTQPGLRVFIVPVTTLRAMGLTLILVPLVTLGLTTVIGTV
jgi:hypothetical protein